MEEVKKISTKSLTYKLYVWVHYVINGHILDKDMPYKWFCDTKFYIPSNTCDLWVKIGIGFFFSSILIIPYSVCISFQKAGAILSFLYCQVEKSLTSLFEKIDKKLSKICKNIEIES